MCSYQYNTQVNNNKTQALLQNKENQPRSCLFLDISLSNVNEAL